MTNRTLRLLGDSKVELAEIEVPAPAAGEVLVRVEATAICGSERHALDAGSPINLGHEAVGVVVDGASAGQRVGISAVRGCGDCAPCRAGLQTRCLAGPRGQVGLHADYVAVGATSLLELPDAIDPADAVLLAGDTLGVPVRALRRVPAEPGSRVLVLGLGPVGLAHVLVRANAGCEVVAIEPSAARRKLGRELGAAAVFEPGDDIGPPPSLVIEATGLAGCVNQALDLVAAGGSVLQSGECAEATISPSAQLIRKEVTYTGCWYFTHDDYPLMRQLWDDGLPIAKLRTHDLPAADAQAAFDAFTSAESGKVVLHWT